MSLFLGNFRENNNRRFHTRWLFSISLFPTLWTRPLPLFQRHLTFRFRQEQRENMEEEPEQINLKFRVYVYGNARDPTLSHSYCLDDFPTATSPQIGSIVIDIRATTFHTLRSKLQFEKSEDMDRRSLIFQEALYLMSRLPNLYDRPKRDLREYYVGFVRKDNNELKIVGRDQEHQTVEEFLGRYEFYSRNLMIIPLSQVTF